MLRRRIVTAALGVLVAARVGPARAADPPEADPGKPMMIREAALPAGFPAAGPVATVILKEYPAHRLARTRGGADGDGRMFMKLFRHIERNDIAMTAPVTMDWSTAAQGGGGTPETMAFLYAKPDLGTAGPDPEDPAVVVEDIPAITVASVGLRGDYGAATFRKGRDQVEQWLREHPEWTAVGPPRMLAYNSPFVPWFLKFAEVQLPVTRVGDAPQPR
jgi:hypothetical protein